jgi:hypothetical protein
VAAVLLLWAPPAEAAIFKGISQIIGGILQVPVSIVMGTVNGPPLVGTLLGAVNGVFGGVASVASGAFELAASGVGLAKMVAPYVLPFLL